MKTNKKLAWIMDINIKFLNNNFKTINIQFQFYNLIELYNARDRYKK